MLSTSLEKYLVCIYQHLEKNEEIKSSELARELKQPLQKTVQALQRMHFQKQIIYSTYQPLKMTDLGKQMARYLIARDNLIEEFFNLLHLDKSDKEAIAQSLSYDSLTKIEKFVLFNRQYPEIAERFELLLQYPLEETILPPLPNSEK